MHRNSRKKRFRRARHLQVVAAIKTDIFKVNLIFLRVVGVTSKVNKLLVMGLDRRKNDKVNLDDPQEWETKTITSAMKTYLRNLPEPLMSFRYHNDFINAVSKWKFSIWKCPCLSVFFSERELRQNRVQEVHKLLYKIPEKNFEVLKILIKHLTK